MTARILFEYLVNSLWQLPLLAAGTWLLIRFARPRLFAQHMLWLATLLLAVALPLRGIDLQRTNTGHPSLLLLFPADSTADPARHDMRSLSAIRLEPVYLEARTIDWLAALYALAIAFNLTRLAYGWMSARRLLANSIARPLTTAESSLLMACAARLQLPIERIPEVRFTSAMDACPMIVSALRPVLLLPEHLLDTDDQAIPAILSHELAHVRRRDSMVNLAARIVSLPIAYHPATAMLHRRIGQTREMICDAHAAATADSSSAYARSLLSLAERIVHPRAHVEAVGLFDQTANTLEERIMKLTEPLTSQRHSVRAARIAAGSMILLAAAGTAATFHVKPSTPVVYAAEVQEAAPAPAPTAPSPTPAPTPEPRLPQQKDVDNKNRHEATELLMAQVTEEVNTADLRKHIVEAVGPSLPPEHEARQEPVSRPDPPPGVMRIGNGVTPPKVLYAPEPEYTDEARAAKISGNILLYLQVDENGLPNHVRILHGIGNGLDEKAIEAVMGYKFKPAMKDGQPVKVEMNIEVNFQLF